MLSVSKANRRKTKLRMHNRLEIFELTKQPHKTQLSRDVCFTKIPKDCLELVMAEGYDGLSALSKQFCGWLFAKNQLIKPLLKLLARRFEKYHTAILSNAGEQTREMKIVSNCTTWWMRSSSQPRKA